MSRSPRTLVYPALAVALVAAACEQAPEPPPDARVAYDTINGVVHVVSGNRGAWVRGGSWNVDRQGTTIGEVDGPEEYTFGRIAGVAVGRDGQIYVGDAQANEIRVYSSDGVFMRRFGRSGEGPGEFRNISGVTRAPEGIAVLDGRLGRVTVFRPGGTVVRTFRLDRAVMRLEHGGLMRFDERGRYYDRVSLDPVPHVDEVGVVVYGRDGEPEDTVRLDRVDRPQLVVERDGVPVMSFPRPFHPQPSLAIGPDGRIYFARGGDYRIDVFSPQGAALRVLRRRVQPRPVTSEEQDSAISLVQMRFGQGGARPPTNVELPTSKPVIAGLMVDDLGNLWVETFGDAHWSNLEWAVHDPSGRYLGTVATPRISVMHIGADFVAGVQEDELGVQRVVVLPIRR